MIGTALAEQIEEAHDRQLRLESFLNQTSYLFGDACARRVEAAVEASLAFESAMAQIAKNTKATPDDMDEMRRVIAELAQH